MLSISVFLYSLLITPTAELAFTVYCTVYLNTTVNQFEIVDIAPIIDLERPTNYILWMGWTNRKALRGTIKAASRVLTVMLSVANYMCTCVFQYAAGRTV